MLPDETGGKESFPDRTGREDCFPDGTGGEKCLPDGTGENRAIGYQMGLVEQIYWLPDRTGRTEILVTGQNR